MAAAKGKAKADPKPNKERVPIQYYHDGMPISPYQNKLSSIAYWYTKGIDTSKPRIGSKRLVALLNALGVENPRAEPFSVELPNGIVISATVGALVPIIPRSERPRKDTAQAKKDRAQLTQDSIAEGKAVAAWRKGGEVGPKPETPATDKLENTLRRKPTKGSQKAAQVTRAVTAAREKTATKRAAVPAKKAAARKTPATKRAGGPKTFTGARPKKATAAASKKSA